MNISNGPVRPIPTDTDPAKTVCLQIQVPDDRQWIAALYDAIYQLTYWFAWDRDNAHTGAIIAKRWLKAMDTLRLCPAPGPTNDGCCGEDGETSLIRQNPDNPCLIESSMDGTHWCTLIDLSLCIAPTGQPGGGADQPQPGGGDACYNGVLNASSQWLLPTIVSAGDTIDFSDIQGAGTDGTGHWYCPDGQIFFAGACVGSLSFNGGDPAPSIHHMALVAKIGAVYYDITGGVITVPGGISNAPVTVQVNDGTLTDNAGDYKFKVCVTNNTAVPYHHEFDFVTGPHGWTRVTGDVIAGGTWTPGSGWAGDLGVQTDGNQRVVCYIKPPVLTFHYTKFTVYYDEVVGEITAPADLVTETPDGALTPLITGTGQHFEYTGSFSPAGTFYLYHTASRHFGGAPSPLGSILVTKIVIEGPGADPFSAF